MRLDDLFQDRGAVQALGEIAGAEEFQECAMDESISTGADETENEVPFPKLVDDFARGLARLLSQAVGLSGRP